MKIVKIGDQMYIEKLMVNQSVSQSVNQIMESISLRHSLKIFLMIKSAGLALKILLLVPKPTGHLVPRCSNDFQLCLLVSILYCQVFL